MMKTFSVEDLGSRAGSLGLRTFLASAVNGVGLVPLLRVYTAQGLEYRIFASWAFGFSLARAAV